MKRLALVTVVILAMMSACAVKAPCPAVSPSPAADTKTFAYEPTDITPEAKPLKEEAHITITQLKFKVSDLEGIPKSFKAFLIKPKKLAGRVPAIIILPPTEGDYELLLDFGRFFAERGYVAMVVKRRGSFFNPERVDISYDHKLMIQTVIDVRRSIDWLQKQEYVDPEKIGIMGISLGAIIAELSTAVDKRIKAAAFFLGSSELDQVLQKTGYSRLIAYRRTLEDKLEGTRSEKFYRVKEQLANIDPKNYGRYIDPKKVIFICARFDAIIPYSISKKTICNLGNPEAYCVPAGHYSSFFFKGWALKRVFQHFEKIFSPPPAS